MLKSSTKSVARDVVSTLIDPQKDEGALLKLTKIVESLPEYEEEADEEEKRMTSRVYHPDAEGYSKRKMSSDKPKSAKPPRRR